MTAQDVTAIATQLINEEIPDILAQENMLWNKLMKNKKYIDGGDYLQIPISVLENLSSGFIPGNGATISVNPNQTTTSGSLQWKYFYQNFSVSLDDYNKTQDSKQAIIDMFRLKRAQCLNSAVRSLSQAAYQTGTGTSINNLNGMADIFAASGTAYAGVNNSTYANWLPLYDTSAATPTYAVIDAMMATLSERIGQDPVDPVLSTNYKLDFMLSRAKVMSAYKNIMQAQQRFVNKVTLESGFEGVEVNNVFWHADSYAPGTLDGSTNDSYLFLLSSDSFHLFYKYGFGSGKKSPLDTAQTLPTQPLGINVGYSSGNMVCTNRRVNGLFKNLVI